MTPKWFLWLRTHAHIRCSGDSQPHTLLLPPCYTSGFLTPEPSPATMHFLSCCVWYIKCKCFQSIEVLDGEEKLCLSLSVSHCVGLPTFCVSLSLRTCCWPVKWRELQWSWQTLAWLLKYRETSRLGLVRKHTQWHTRHMFWTIIWSVIASGLGLGIARGPPVRCYNYIKLPIRYVILMIFQEFSPSIVTL